MSNKGTKKGKKIKTSSRSSDLGKEVMRAPINARSESRVRRSRLFKFVYEKYQVCY
jgi:hypothetical protein